MRKHPGLLVFAPDSFRRGLQRNDGELVRHEIYAKILLSMQTVSRHLVLVKKKVFFNPRREYIPRCIHNWKKCSGRWGRRCYFQPLENLQVKCLFTIRAGIAPAVAAADFAGPHRALQNRHEDIIPGIVVCRGRHKDIKKRLRKGITFLFRVVKHASLDLMQKTLSGTPDLHDHPPPTPGILFRSR